MKRSYLLLAAFLLTGVAAVTALAAGNVGFLPSVALLLLGGESGGVPVVVVPLNDTGITWGGNAVTGNNPDCSGAEFGAQDCSYGRDVTDCDDSDGHAGFTFIKLDNDGVELADQTQDYATKAWSCVKDNDTGVIWEVKTDDSGLYDRDNKKTWYNTDPLTNGGFEGDDGGGNNTEAYVAAVNVDALCGFSDWRMPTIKELVGLVSYYQTSLAVDTAYFPNINSLQPNYWAGTSAAEPVSVDSGYAWAVNFGYGYSANNILKHSLTKLPVRLVRTVD